jgi:hypothetical protein
MSQRQERISLQQPLIFHSLSQVEVVMQITELVLLLDDEAGEALFRITFEVDFPTYEQIEKHQMFNLLPKVCHAHDDDFLPDRPIEIEACLRPSLLAEATQSDLAIEPIAQAMFASDQPPLPYRFTESWLAQSVRQAVSLPAELAETGTLKSGYTTIWNETYFSHGS